MRRVARLALAAAVLAAPACSSLLRTGNRDPDAARLVTSDIPLFWRAYDSAQVAADPAAVYDRLYVEGGSPGVQGFREGRIEDGATLARTIAKHPRFYASIRATTLAIDTAAAVKDAVRRSLRRLAELHPDAVFPDVYFVIGRMNSGGTSTRAGLVIGAEMYARTPYTPLDELGAWNRAVLASFDVLPYIVAHELVHYQQPLLGGETLLERAFREGSADFVGELASGGIINREAHAYGDAHEAELWREFSAAMHGTDVSAWMYQGDRATDRPADLGYYVGYRIAKAYYERAADKRKALERILRSRDVEELLRESGYAESVTGR